MKDYLCTIIYEDLEHETYQRLIAKWPNAAFHDKQNRLFAGVDELAIDPLIVDTLLPDYAQVYDEEGNAIGPSYIDALVPTIAPYLFAEDRGRPIHIRRSILSQLYRHPAYQLYCGNYETVEALNVDYKKVFGVDVDDSKDLETLNAESRILLKQVLT
jgi:hypothetical protein